MLDLVEMMFARYGIQNLRYDGSMDRSAREAVLKRFREPGGPRVILIRYVFFAPRVVRRLSFVFSSMRCGGVGLNLTSANRIVK